MSTDVVSGGVPGAPGTPSPAPTADVPGSTPETPAPTPTPSSPAPNFGLTPGEIAVLRMIATDADFRVKFAEDPIGAITGANLKLTTTDYVRLEKLTKEQLEQVASGIGVLAGAGPSGLRSQEGTNTLVYAVIVALLLA